MKWLKVSKLKLNLDKKQVKLVGKALGLKGVMLPMCVTGLFLMLSFLLIFLAVDP